MRRRPPLDDPDLTLADLFAAAPCAARPFLDRGMLCPGCPVAPFHTLADAARDYALDADGFRNEVARAVQAGHVTGGRPDRY
ncbi:hypothetical protein [Pseudoponticoccus marisrubri]|uniref:DUF1858 domain-containing protein n=1 Tax=Pseudoponticoccus marisrubri TaxID=1685382 RepID=A0A0W7WII7_9RHOB|nr:hypothetical protein [Pseudoponticoccus marisrubri]KUF10327.1 hypothetical protein AVJ23_13050 [Pseudoponticoccus marisrubri]